MILKALFFYLFAGVTLASGLMVIAARNPVTSVLFLILAFVIIVIGGIKLVQVQKQRGYGPGSYQR